MRRRLSIIASLLFLIALPALGYAAERRPVPAAGGRVHAGGHVPKVHFGHHGRGAGVADLVFDIIGELIELSAAQAAFPGCGEEPIISCYNSAYDTVMTGYFSSPRITGYRPPIPGPRGYTPYLLPIVPPAPLAPAAATPMVGPVVISLEPHRILDGGIIYQYDGLTGQYIRLAQWDAVRALPPPAPPR